MKPFVNVVVALVVALAPFAVRADQVSSGAVRGLPSDEIAPLDPPYPVEARPAAELESAPSFGVRELLPARSDLASMMEIQTPVKSQESRGTCSIFSATAMLEAMLIRQGYIGETEKDAFDLSEEWLQYVSTRYQTADGSYSPKNFNSILENGFLYEEEAPYDGEEWAEPLYGNAEARCGQLADVNLASCLIGHWNPDLLVQPWYVLNKPESGVLYDPEFLKLRTRAHELRREFIEGNVTSKYYNVWSAGEVKRMLAAGEPVAMGMTVYYGAWNHRIADELSIGRNYDHWYGGIVGYPEPGSMDLAHSLEKAAGHSVLLVGYDDEVEVETTVLMEDGTTRSFRYKGVYYFKNSWGTTAFGRDMVIDGVAYPGYGMITQQYVHEYGSFYRFPLKQAE